MHWPWYTFSVRNMTNNAEANDAIFYHKKKSFQIPKHFPSLHHANVPPPESILNDLMQHFQGKKRERENGIKKQESRGGLKERENGWNGQRVERSRG